MLVTTDIATFEATALRIGRQICRDAIWHEDQCTWLTVTHETGSSQTYTRTLYNEFYIGTAGVAYFLAALHRLRPDPILRKTALGAIRHSLAQRNQTEPQNRLGFYRGWPGIAFVACYAAEHLKAPRLLKRAKELIREICKIEIRQAKLDIVEGVASAIPALIKIQQMYPTKQLGVYLLALGEDLLERAHRTDRGWSWKTIDQGAHHLTGYAHGSAGFSHALLELFVFTGEERFREAASESIRYENSWYNEKECNWPDFRSNGGMEQPPDDFEYPCVSAWCHGAPGIGLSRLRAYEVLGDTALAEEARTAIETTRRQTPMTEAYNLSLCHGICGNVEVILNASKSFQDDSYLEEARDFGRRALELFADRAWPNGIGTNHQIPDFMLGLSGMGYFFLRLIDPVRFESMLLLQGQEAGNG